MATAKERLAKKRREYRWGGVVVIVIGFALIALMRLTTEPSEAVNVYYYGQASIVPVLGLVLFIASFIIKK